MHLKAFYSEWEKRERIKGERQEVCSVLMVTFGQNDPGFSQQKFQHLRRDLEGMGEKLSFTLWMNAVKHCPVLFVTRMSH